MQLPLGTGAALERTTDTVLSGTLRMPAAPVSRIERVRAGWDLVGFGGYPVCTGANRLAYAGGVVTAESPSEVNTCPGIVRQSRVLELSFQQHAGMRG